MIMYPLENVYSFKTYKAFKNRDDIKDTKQTSKCIENEHGWKWEAKSYDELIEYISFLTCMNKRLVLYYRGQTIQDTPTPTIFRDFWHSPYGTKIKIPSPYIYWKELPSIGKEVCEICNKVGVPRPRTIELIREAQMAIIQHYNLWPTPLLDITQNLRMATTVALTENRCEGFLFVFGLPNTTASVSYDVDQHIVLARLESVCPPSARRPHIQNGFLVGRHPLYDLRPDHDLNANPNLHNMNRRLVACIRLINEPSDNNKHGSFWDDDFFPISADRLYPNDNDKFDHLINDLKLKIRNRITNTP